MTEGLKATRREKEERAKQKDAAKKKREQEALAKLQKGALSPKDMFRPPHSDEYGAWDGDGMPTTLKDGTPLAATRIKRLKKEWETQRKAHEKYLLAAKGSSS